MEEVIICDKHLCLLLFGIDYCCKKFNSPSIMVEMLEYLNGLYSKSCQQTLDYIGSV